MPALTRRALLSTAVGLASLVSMRTGYAAERSVKLVAPSHLIGFDPHNTGHFVRRLEIGETLLDVGPKGEIVPGLAASMSLDRSGTIWSFPILPGRYFHDGNAVTAEAVAASLRLSSMVAASPLRQAPIGSIGVEGNAVVISLLKPYALLPAILASSSLVILAPASYDANAEIRSLIASGPYQLVKFEDGERLETVAVRRTADGGPSVQRVIYQVVDDAETRARMVETGGAHIASTILPVTAVRLRTNSTLNVVSTPSLRLRYVMVNSSHQALGDRRVRHALSLSMDRVGAARAVLRDQSFAATQMFPPILPEWCLAGETKLPFDPERAERLLDEAGWHRNPASGMRERDGQRLSLELLTYAWRPELSPLSQIMQAQWRKIGIDTNVDIVNTERIVRRAREGTLELALFARNYFLVPHLVANLIDDFAPTSEANGWGAVGWHSEELTQALRQYSETTHEDVRSHLRSAILRILHDELPIIPHSWYESNLVHSKDVTGVTVDPFETSYRLSRVRWA